MVGTLAEPPFRSGSASAAFPPATHPFFSPIEAICVRDGLDQISKSMSLGSIPRHELLIHIVKTENYNVKVLWRQGLFLRSSPRPSRPAPPRVGRGASGLAIGRSFPPRWRRPISR